MSALAHDFDHAVRRIRDVADEADHAVQAFAATTRSLTTAASVIAVHHYTSRARNRATQVAQALPLVSAYAERVQVLQLRLGLARQEVAESEAAYAQQGSLHALALDAYEVALGVGAGVLDLVGVDRLAENLREEKLRLETAEARMEAAHRDLRLLLDEYDRDTDDFVRAVVTLDFVYVRAHRDLSDPAALATPGPVAWVDFGGRPLYGADDRPDISDVRQGHIGDCYFIAALIALVNSPGGAERIRRMIEQNPDGTFTVHFADGDVIVDGDLAEVAGTTAYAGADGEVGYWAAILEKAYAQREGSYDAIVGGNAGDILHDQFGLDVTIHQSPGDGDFDRLADAAAHDRPATFAVDLSKIQDGRDPNSNHELAVIGSYIGPDGQRMFEVANPWNSSGAQAELPSGASIDIGGRFTISEADLKAIAHAVTY